MQSFYSVKSDKKLFILGDMLELGDTSINEHQKIINELNKEQSEAILIGTEFGKCEHTFPQFKDVFEAKEWLQQKAYNDYFILLKGSRGIKLEEIKDLL
jgi:UDP-N-acetylmuramoyl-tripeptide--D-alanyl-D-alanine ligase